VRPILGVLIEALHSLDEKIAVLDAEISRRAEEDEDARRLKTIPGIGPVTAAAISALAPPAQTFARGRDFAAWLGLTPLQRSTGGKQKLGGTSKRGERTIRRLLIIGASAVVRWAARKGAPAGSWLERMLARKPRMLVAVALANKMARIIWALLAKVGFIELRSWRHKRPVAGCRRCRKVVRRHGAIVDETGSGKPVLDRAP
jgi:transposase